MSRVVVGVDGSPASTTALCWAIRRAADHGWTVEAVVAWPEPEAAFVHEVPGHFNHPRARAVSALRAAVRTASMGVANMPPVVMAVENGAPVEVLVRRSAEARLLVLGAGSAADRGSGPRHKVVGRACEVLAKCPVVVVMGQEATR